MSLETKLKKLPKTPGVYFHRDKKGKIIYVGKAARLNNRVRQYFQNSTKRTADIKTQKLIAEIADTDWVEVDNELEALFLEAEMIKRYKPRFNILERDDKSNTYVRIDRKSTAPTVTIVRQPLDDGAEYYGPYIGAYPLRKALKYLRKIFPYSTHSQLPKRACLQYHIGLCPGPETGDYDEAEYKRNLSALVSYLKGNRVALVKDLEKEMKQLAKAQQYEKAAIVRNQLRNLKSLTTHIVFGDKENLDLSKDHALSDLMDIFELTQAPRRIEGYDISHMSGTNTVASMVVFTNGVSDKSSYRKFKMRSPGNDDFLHMREVLTRRLGERNQKSWGLPDLVLIDGGKGQLSSALEVARGLNVDVPMIGIAKRHEEIIVMNQGSNVSVDHEQVRSMQGTVEVGDEFTVVRLPTNSHLVSLLRRIRDESHRFAVNYHSTLKTGAQRQSILDEIPGVGAVTKKKLLRKFGSLKGIKQARKEELASVVGYKRAMIIRQYLRKK
ncbi:MAG: excinuclease ABC subunit UvrC [Patescibacteria group bacterium]